jgi:ribosome-binding factor A
MSETRIDRVNALLREELSDLIRRELKDPRVGTVTVTGVETSRELDVARVYVQTLGDPARQAEAVEALRGAAGYLRSKLGRRIRLRKIPELRFELDRTLERATRIERLLAAIREGKTAADIEGSDRE